MSRNYQTLAYRYGMELAARDAGYHSLQNFTKQAYAIPGALIGAGIGAGAGALSDPDNRLRNAAIGGVGGAAIGGIGGHLLGQSAAKSKGVIDGAKATTTKVENAAANLQKEQAITDAHSVMGTANSGGHHPQVGNPRFGDEIPTPDLGSANPDISFGRMQTMSVPDITVGDQLKGLGQYGLEQGRLGLEQLKSRLAAVIPANQV